MAIGGGLRRRPDQIRTSHGPNRPKIAAFRPILFSKEPASTIWRIVVRRMDATGMEFDAVVVGSGFGGAVMACRLAEAGYRVLVLERGRRWNRFTYPRQPNDPWLWNAETPERENGWLDFRPFPHMAVATGAAVGGGSLLSANICSEPRRATFAAGWPAEITYEELKPYLTAVAQFVNAQAVPLDHWAKRAWMEPRIRREQAQTGHDPAAKAISSLQRLKLAVSFDPEFSAPLPGDQPDPFPRLRSRRFINAQGVEQGTCVRLGECEIGCPVDAKNTLDCNYIPWAEKHSADVRSLHLVTAIEPTDGGYRVYYDRIEHGRRIRGRASTRIVIVAAGSLGSTELLLRCRDVYRTLPRINSNLGQGWSPNANFLPPAFYEHRDGTSGFDSSAEDLLTESVDFSSAGCSSLPDPIRNHRWTDTLLPNHDKVLTRNQAARLFLDAFRKLMRGNGITQWPWPGADGGPGRGTLSLQQTRPGEEPTLRLAWNAKVSASVFEAMRAMQENLAERTGGHPVVPGAWMRINTLVTPQPLGGCNIGNCAETGVVNHAGEVFGYRNLYVADGAIVPVALGTNPSQTIAALAERCAALLLSDGR